MEELVFEHYEQKWFRQVEDMLEQLSHVEQIDDKEVERIEKEIKSKEQAYVRIVGTIKGEVVCYGAGILDTKIRGGRCLHIEDIVVKNKWHKKGIGQKLILELIEIARERKCYKVQTSASENNVKFYEKCGLNVCAVALRIFV